MEADHGTSRNKQANQLDNRTCTGIEIVAGKHRASATDTQAQHGKAAICDIPGKEHTVFHAANFEIGD
jgi:hypothetical protein